MTIRVLHLVDDTTAGGVMQVVKYLTTSPDHAKIAHHQLLTVTRGGLVPPKTTADIVVSHLAVSWRTLPALIALRLRFGRARLVHVEHSYTEGFVNHNVPNIRRFETMLRFAFRQFGRVVAVSAGQREWLCSRDLVAQDSLSLVRSFCDLSPFLGVAPHAGPVRHFGAIGRLEPQKGFDLLIKSFRNTADPDIRLSIFGTGSQKEALKELATGDPRICFCGHSETPQDAYRSVDAVVMPSRWEAYGLVAIEAMCAGRPLVCSGVDGLQDHAALGAIIYPEIDCGIFQLPDRRVANHQDPANVMEQLKNENLLAWDTLIMRILRKSEHPPSGGKSTAVRQNRGLRYGLAASRERLLWAESEGNPVPARFQWPQRLPARPQVRRPGYRTVMSIMVCPSNS